MATTPYVTAIQTLEYISHLPHQTCDNLTRVKNAIRHIYKSAGMVRPNPKVLSGKEEGLPRRDFTGMVIEHSDKTPDRTCLTFGVCVRGRVGNSLQHQRSPCFNVSCAFLDNHYDTFSLWWCLQGARIYLSADLYSHSVTCCCEPTFVPAFSLSHAQDIPIMHW